MICGGHFVTCAAELNSARGDKLVLKQLKLDRQILLWVLAKVVE
jgi:hypothetical protein